MGGSYLHGKAGFKNQIQSKPARERRHRKTVGAATSDLVFLKPG
jgi:hypothetical protein